MTDATIPFGYSPFDDDLNHPMTQIRKIPSELFIESAPIELDNENSSSYCRGYNSIREEWQQDREAIARELEEIARTTADCDSGRLLYSLIKTLRDNG